MVLTLVLPVALSTWYESRTLDVGCSSAPAHCATDIPLDKIVVNGILKCMITGLGIAPDNTSSEYYGNVVLIVLSISGPGFLGIGHHSCSMWLSWSPFTLPERPLH